MRKTNTEYLVHMQIHSSELKYKNIILEHHANNFQ
jgi:hypothetical protein